MRATIEKARAAMRGSRRGASASRGWRKPAASSKSIRKSRRWERFGRPKRALGAYMFFCKDQYASISADNPNIPFGDVGRILGSRWQQLSEKDKKALYQKSRGRQETLREGTEAQQSLMRITMAEIVKNQ